MNFNDLLLILLSVIFIILSIFYIVKVCDYNIKEFLWYQSLQIWKRVVVF
jgi:hypothetical protein